MQLWEPKKCCCCCDLRTGSIVIGILILVGGCFSLLGGVKTLAVQDTDIAKLCEDEEDPVECRAIYRKIEVGMSSSSILTACFHIIFSSFLLYGIIKKKTTFFIPLMTVYIIQIAIMILASVAVLILLMVLGIPFGFLLFLAIFLGLAIFLETYFLLVIRAYYYDIKRQKGQVHTALEDQHIESSPYPVNEVPPYPDQQVPPYPGQQVPPYPGQQVPLYPGQQVPPYPGKQVPPYPGYEVPPYPGSDTPLVYPDQKFSK